MKSKGRDIRFSSRRKFWVERLEERYLLTATPLEIAICPPEDFLALANAPAAPAVPGGGTELLVVPDPPEVIAPFPLEQTFLLHSNPLATKVIYLDFDGFLTRNTPWNTAYNQPNIVTPSFSLDADHTYFSDEERTAIQIIWESVREDFRPFDVDVTTEDPGVENLINSGDGDIRWGIRVAIGGSDGDWQYPVTGHPSGGIAFINSFNDGIDQPAFAFAGDSSVAYTAETISHEVGHTLGLTHDGQIRFWRNSTDKVTEPSKEKISEYYPGHAIYSEEILDPDTGDVIGYAILPNYSPTGWSPIMGGASNYLTQWSFGEYPGANNIQDDLAIITDGHNGFTWSTDDHSNTTTGATPLQLNADTYFGEGVIGEHPSPGVSDADNFSFTVGGTGEFLTFDINPYSTTPVLESLAANLDILATIRDSSGVIIATSNPRDFLDAGSHTVGYPNIDPNDLEFIDPNLGWRAQVDIGTGFVSQPDDSNLNLEWRNLAALLLQPGTYYISVEGTGRPITYINGDIYPGPIIDPPGAPDAAKVKLPPDDSDWGYSNYGSLGYYSITGTRQKGSLVGVDFDNAGGEAPQNWNSFTGSDGQNATLTNLISESGAPVPYTLSISTTGTLLQTAGTQPIDTFELPEHYIPLDNLDGYLVGDTGVTTTFTWNNLDPSSYYTVYVFAHADFDIHNVVTVTGQNLVDNVLVPQTITFDQEVDAQGLEANMGPSEDGDPTDDLRTFAVEILSDSSGHIVISVTNGAGTATLQSAVAGLAISPDRRIPNPQSGSISGQKWNDLDGDQIQDSDEPGLEGWTIYIDQNNNGKLDTITIPGKPAIPAVPGVTQTVQAAISEPLEIPDQDNTGLTSSLQVTALGTVTDLTVSLDITHPYVGDLRAVLITPSGTRLKLFSNVGLDGDDFHNTVFNDSASASITTAEAPYTGTFRAEQPLSNLDGEIVTGTWKLEIKDLNLGDFGTLNSWSITVTDSGTPEIPATPDTFKFAEPNVVTNVDGTYSFNNLTPGVYNIREYFDPVQITDGWTQTWAPTPITVTSGANIVGQDFGNWIPPAPRGSIQGQKFNDLDHDGVKDNGESGLAGWVVFLDADNDGIRDVSPAPVVVESTDVDKQIVDLTTIKSKLTVISPGSVSNMEVTLDITHSFVGDLEAFLTSPSGRRIKLFSRDGGQYNDFINLTFSDSAARSINTIGFNDLPYEDSTWKPEEPLSTFDGDEAAGDWTLSITDTVESDEGTLDYWSLSFTSSELFTTTDASGLYQFKDLDPGNYVVREEAKPGWTQVPPAVTSIPGATWSNAHWDVTVGTLAVPNVDFGSYVAVNLPGDYYRNLVVDAGDYVLWRKTLGSNVGSGQGADGDGNGVVEQPDLAVWRTNYGSTFPASGSGSGLATAAAPGAAAQSDQGSGSAPAASGPFSKQETSLSKPVASPVILVAASGSASPAIETSESIPAAATTSDSAQSPAGSAQVFQLISPNSAIEHDSVVIARPSESASQSDLGLLAWLAASSVGEQAGSMSLSDDDLAVSYVNDDADSMDVAFELLEGNALVLSAI